MQKSTFQYGNVNFLLSYETLHSKQSWLMLFQDRKAKPRHLLNTSALTFIKVFLIFMLGTRTAATNNIFMSESLPSLWTEFK